jgi:hypothetical protein
MKNFAETVGDFFVCEVKEYTAQYHCSLRGEIPIDIFPAKQRFDE